MEKVEKQDPRSDASWVKNFSLIIKRAHKHVIFSMMMMMLVILLLTVVITDVSLLTSSCILGRHRFRRGGPAHVPDRQDDRPDTAHTHAHALPAGAHIW